MLSAGRRIEADPPWRATENNRRISGEYSRIRFTNNSCRAICHTGANNDPAPVMVLQVEIGCRCVSPARSGSPAPPREKHNTAGKQNPQSQTLRDPNISQMSFRNLMFALGNRCIYLTFYFIHHLAGMLFFTYTETPPSFLSLFLLNK